MSIYNAERSQEAQAWVQEIEALPPEALAGELINRAYEVVASRDQGAPRSAVERHISFLFDPEEVEEFRTQKEASAFVTEIEGWLKGGAEVREDPAEQPKYLSELASRRLLSQVARIDEVLDRAEFGVSSGEGQDGKRWSTRETVGSVREVIRLQDSLEMPIASERLRELVIHGLEKPANGTAARLLIQIANKADDRAAFIAAGDKYERALEGQENTYGFEAEIVRTATKFIEAGRLDDRILGITLNALGHYDPVHNFYPVDCARLGLALRKVA